MTEYFIHSTLVLGIVYLIYRLLLWNAQAFQFNRFFLIGSFILALGLPLFEFEISSDQTLHLPFNDASILEQKITKEQIQFSFIEPINQNQKQLTSFQSIYLLGLTLLGLRFIFRLFKLYQLSKGKYFISKGLRFIPTQKDSIFSFFNCLFVPEKIYQKEQLPNELIDHEKVHANEMHSLDLILVEIGTLIAWLNPMVWLMKKAIEENHEFIADSKAAIIKADYCTILINSSNKKNHPLSSGFSYQSLKKRIQMINQPKPSKMKTKTKIVIALCGITVAFLFSSFQNLTITKPYTIIIDAGHGGKDKGASIESVLEKDLSLIYAQLIENKLTNEGIEVIQLRKEDDFINLEDRVNLVNKLAVQHKADLLLSIHLNKGPTEVNGMQVYLANNYIQEGDTNVNYFPSLRFASQISQDYGTDLKIMPAPFTILKSVNCPAALVELGFLSNEEEREKLLSEKYQNQLSNLIANSVIKSMN